MQRRNAVLAGLIAAGVLAAGLGVGCAGNSPINVDKGTPTPTGPVSFTGAVIPALTNKTCTSASCHGNTNIALNGGIYMIATDQTAMWMNLRFVQGNDGMVVVNTASVATSELLLKPDSGDAGLSHTGGKLWSASDSDYKTVKSWITQGAPDN